MGVLVLGPIVELSRMSEKCYLSFMGDSFTCRIVFIDVNGTTISQSNAILQYICDKACIGPGQT